MADSEGARPARRTGPELNTRQGSSSRPGYAELERRAALELRVAWLREHGHRMFDVDTGGLLSAQLWDFADLLEMLEAEGRWGT